MLQKIIKNNTYMLLMCLIIAFSITGSNIQAQCYPGLADPIITYSHYEDYIDGLNNPCTRFRIPVNNYNIYPDVLFAAAPLLPPCGGNTSSSRSWLQIFDADTDIYIYGFCALGQAATMNNIWFAVVQVNNAPLKPLNVYCDGQVNPNNIINPTPTFSWNFNDPDIIPAHNRNIYIKIWDRECDITNKSAPINVSESSRANTQTAYRIKVGTTAGANNIWDSGKINSTGSSKVYTGPALNQNIVYHWSVKTWDDFGYEGLYADDQTFMLVPNYLDIGLRVWDGSQTVNIAAESLQNHKLRIRKNGVTYGLVLVDPTDPNASSIRIDTGSGGIKALRKL